MDPQATSSSVLTWLGAITAFLIALTGAVGLLIPKVIEALAAIKAAKARLDDQNGRLDDHSRRITEVDKQITSVALEVPTDRRNDKPPQTI
jgi:hypothetical protein